MKLEGDVPIPGSGGSPPTRGRGLKLSVVTMLVLASVGRPPRGGVD